MTAHAVLRRKCACGDTCGDCSKKRELRRFSDAGARGGGTVPPIVHDVLRGPGQPLDASARAFFEPRFGRDLSGVRVHHDARAAESAHAVNALAYAAGSHIVLGSSSAPSRDLLAHELAHAVQQQGAGDAPLTLGDPHDAEEAAADSAAERVLAGGSPLESGIAGKMIVRRRPPGREEETRRDWTDQPPGEETPAELPRAGALDPKSESARQVAIDAVPDMLLSEVRGGRWMRARAFMQSITGLHWQLVAPDGRIVADEVSPVRWGGTSSSDAFFHLRRAHVMRDKVYFVEGTYSLRALGVDAADAVVAHATREFKVIGADLETGKAVTGTHGALTFTLYEQRPRTANTPPGVEVRLEFKPKSSVECMDVAFIQAVQGVTPRGAPSSGFTSNMEQLDARKTPMYWSIDQSQGARSSYYIANTNLAGETADSPKLGHAGRGGSKPRETSLYDWPYANKPGVRRFETCAVCRSGPHQGTVYGCATWGYSTDAQDQITLMPRSFADGPSPSFSAASAEWNRWRMNFKSSRPYALPELKTP